MSPLETTRDARFVPGTNLKGAVAGANWWFLLPDLDAGRVVCLGPQSPAALATLARMSGEVLVSGTPRSLERVRRIVAAQGLANVRILEGSGSIEDGSADVVVLPSGLARRARRRQEREIERILRPDGVLYVEGGRAPARLGGAEALWVAPARGDVRAAALLGDAPTIAYLERRFLGHGLLRRQLVRHPRRFLGRHVLVNRLARRRAVVVCPSGRTLGEGPPRYVRSLAAEAGVDLEGRRWGLSAPGEFPSQKVLLFLFDGAAEAPEYVIKITRDPALNSRLENEWRALTLLDEEGLGSEGSLPHPTFFGRHAGLALVCETAIDGASFAERTHATSDCPYARSAVEWLLRLGSATAHPPPGGAHSVAAELESLLGEFTRIYRIEPDHERFLARQVAALEGGGDGLPLVFQHGDPGPWNLMVTSAGTPAFLDWEAAEPDGMPLWDLFHFLRSYGFAVSRAAGTRDAMRSFAEHYLAESALGQLLVEATRRACTGSGLSPRLVEPLFYLCWVHRALKEATRLAPAGLDDGRYVNLLRLAIEQRQAPVLRRLFSSAADDAMLHGR